MVITGRTPDPCHTHQEALDGATVLVQNLPFSNDSEAPALSLCTACTVYVSRSSCPLPHLDLVVVLPRQQALLYHSVQTTPTKHRQGITHLPCSGHIQVSPSLPLSPLDLCQPRVSSWRVRSCLHLTTTYCLTSSNSQKNSPHCTPVPFLCHHTLVPIPKNMEWTQDHTAWNVVRSHTPIPRLQ